MGPAKDGLVDVNREEGGPSHLRALVSILIISEKAGVRGGSCSSIGGLERRLGE